MLARLGSLLRPGRRVIRITISCRSNTLLGEIAYYRWFKEEDAEVEVEGAGVGVSVAWVGAWTIDSTF